MNNTPNILVLLLNLFGNNPDLKLHLFSKNILNNGIQLLQTFSIILLEYSTIRRI